MDGLERDYAGRLQVVRMDFNDPTNKPALRALRVQGHPTIVLLTRDGRVQPPLLGAQTDGSLRPAVAALVES